MKPSEVIELFQSESVSWLRGKKIWNEIARKSIWEGGIWRLAECETSRNYIKWSMSLILHVMRSHWRFRVGKSWVRHDLICTWKNKTVGQTEKDCSDFEATWWRMTIKTWVFEIRSTQDWITFWYKSWYWILLPSLQAQTTESDCLDLKSSSKTYHLYNL